MSPKLYRNTLLITTTQPPNWGIATLLSDPQTPVSCPSNVLVPFLIQNSIQGHTLHLVVNSISSSLGQFPSLALPAVSQHVCH